MKSQYQLDREAAWASKGFTIFDDAQPAVGASVEAIRVFQVRGFGGVILRTEFKVVPVVRETEHGYADTLNQDSGLGHGEFEAWRECRTYANKPQSQRAQ